MAGETEKKSKTVLAYEFFEQGKRPSDPEVKALGLKPKSTYDYFQRWKRQKKAMESGTTTIPTTIPTTKPSAVPGKPIEAGKITITPENWGMTQHGAILILDTYKRVQQDLIYGDTLGEFLCDTVQMLTRIVDYDKDVV